MFKMNDIMVKKDENQVEQPFVNIKKSLLNFCIFVFAYIFIYNAFLHDIVIMLLIFILFSYMMCNML
jgi:hypothetical protein